ncbi:MAG: DUF429 domain-containing protein [Pseudomonadota bacterium]
MFEVYPHPAMIELFALDGILTYKKGRVAERRADLRQLQSLIGTLGNEHRGLLPSRWLDEVLDENPQSLQGTALKRLGDRLDAVFCAYLAWHCWRWGAARNRAFGSPDGGCIVVPSVRGATP